MALDREQPRTSLTYGGYVTMYVSISDHDIHIPLLGPCNTHNLLTFLDALNRDIVPENKRDGAEGWTYVFMWENVHFHHSRVGQMVVSST